MPDFSTNRMPVSTLRSPADGRHVRTIGGTINRLEQRDLPLCAEPVVMLVHAGMTVPEPGERQPIRIDLDAEHHVFPQRGR